MIEIGWHSETKIFTIWSFIEEFDSCSQQFVKIEMLVEVHFDNLKSPYIEGFPNKQKHSCIRTSFGL